METLMKYWNGYVRISVQGGQPERFFNLCRNKGIILREVHQTEVQKFICCMTVRDFFLLRNIRSKTGVHIHILEKHGLPFFFYRNKKRKAFFLGILVCIFLMLVLSCRIWNIHIEGNQKNSTPELLSFLESQGITHGIPKRQVDCSAIASAIRRQYPEITWVSAKLEGTRLLLTIQEGTVLKKPSKESDSPCHLVADVSGTIVEMVTRKGTPALQTGDSCKKGDLLVSGILEIKNDSQEVVRQEYVAADADVYVRHKVAYYHQFPLSYQKKIYTGETKKSGYLKIGNWYLGSFPKKKKHWENFTEEKNIFLTENFKIPVSLGICREMEYKEISAVYTEQQAKKLAREKLNLYQKQLLEQGAVILSNEIHTEIDPHTCTSSGFLWVVEKIGRKTPLRLPF